MKTPRPILRPLACGLLGLLPLATRADNATAGVWPGMAQIEFHATSTLHDFSGRVRTESFQASVAADGAAITLGGTAVVAVAGIDTRHAKRDENMRGMFDIRQFPWITGVVPPVRIDPADPPPVPLSLTIRGQTQALAASLTDWQVHPDRIRFQLRFPLSLKQCGLAPPVMLGFIRVGDTVDVNIQVELTHPASGQPP